MDAALVVVLSTQEEERVLMRSHPDPVSKQPFRAGDAVSVPAIGETWVIAVYDAERDQAFIAGWPCTLVDEASKKLVLAEACDDAEHELMKRAVSEMRGDNGSKDPRRIALETVLARGGVP